MFVKLGRAGWLKIWDRGCYGTTRGDTAGLRCSMVSVRERHDLPDRPSSKFALCRVDRGRLRGR